MKIAVIPARGGSKRIPRKNIKDFCGRPMIAWAISAAKESGLFDHIIVSTDDEEIARIAKNWGAETPFVRPVDLADDLTPTVPVIAHAVKSCLELGWDADYVCCIYPCVPFLQIGDLVSALDLADTQNADFVYPVTEYAHPIQRAMRRLPGGQMQFFSPQFELTRTQDLEKTYHDAGQFYWAISKSWLSNDSIIGSNSYAITIDSSKVQDIDTPEDRAIAELMFEQLMGFFY